MPRILELDKNTIDQIAAGEVVERPSSVVKELVENAIDAKAAAVTVEIKDGGTTLIRVTDNGCGIEKEQVRIAFRSHTTSKIRTVDDLQRVSSLGFRGEALSSIASVSQVELITKTDAELTGSRYRIEGGEEKEFEEIGAPNGTTFLVRNLFYNTPARRKFLKSASAEAGAVSDLAERMALSHPDVSFKFIKDGQVKMHTSGNGSVRDMIYHIYGREIAANLLPVEQKFEHFSVSGYAGKPVIARGNRNYENYFVNGRYVKDRILSGAIEEGYRGFLMQHKYPFTVLYLTVDRDYVDVNVHPAKMELRFSDGEMIYWDLSGAVSQALKGKELIPDAAVRKGKSAPAPENTEAGARGKETAGNGGTVSSAAQDLSNDKKMASGEKAASSIPEPFEANRLKALRESVAKDSPYEHKYTNPSEIFKNSEAGNGGPDPARSRETGKSENRKNQRESVLESGKAGGGPSAVREKSGYGKKDPISEAAGGAENSGKQDGLTEVPAEKFSGEGIADPSGSRQMDFTDLKGKKGQKFFQAGRMPDYQIIGQAFDTYWIVESGESLYLIDQHAAHEKVLYERMMKAYRNKDFNSQYIDPPLILSLTMREESLLLRYLDQFRELGFEIEPFGGKEYAVRAVPSNLYGIDGQELVLSLVDNLGSLSGKEAPELVLEKVADMACKAAVKGNQKLSRAEAEALIRELLTLDNPFNCPHGRPVIISASRHEIEKMFGRIQ